MNVQFDTSALTKVEAQGIIVLLTTLFPVSSSQPVSSSPAVPSAVQPDSTPAPTPSTGPVLVSPTVQPSADQPTTTRHRRTKAEMAAAKDAPADPTQGSAVEAAVASDTTGPAIVRRAALLLPVKPSPSPPTTCARSSTPTSRSTGWTRRSPSSSASAATASPRPWLSIPSN